MILGRANRALRLRTIAWGVGVSRWQLPPCLPGKRGEPLALSFQVLCEVEVLPAAARPCLPSPGRPSMFPSLRAPAWCRGAMAGWPMESPAPDSCSTQPRDPDGCWPKSRAGGMRRAGCGQCSPSPRSGLCRELGNLYGPSPQAARAATVLVSWHSPRPGLRPHFSTEPVTHYPWGQGRH